MDPNASLPLVFVGLALIAGFLAFHFRSQGEKYKKLYHQCMNKPPEKIRFLVCVNGIKVDELRVPRNESKREIQDKAAALRSVNAAIDGREVKKIYFGFYKINFFAPTPREPSPPNEDAPVLISREEYDRLKALENDSANTG